MGVTYRNMLRNTGSYRELCTAQVMCKNGVQIVLVSPDVKINPELRTRQQDSPG